MLRSLFFFFFNDTATTEIYTLSLHDALPISRYRELEAQDRQAGEQQHQRVADSPAEPDRAGAPQAPLLGRDRRDGDDVVGVERMLRAQQEAQTQHGQERKLSCHPPLVCISRRGSWRRRSISTSLALIPTRSSSLRCSAPRSRRACHPARSRALISSREAPARNGCLRSIPSVA